LVERRPIGINVADSSVKGALVAGAMTAFILLALGYLSAVVLPMPYGIVA
jgi:hypothetical protein